MKPILTFTRDTKQVKKASLSKKRSIFNLRSQKKLKFLLCSLKEMIQKLQIIYQNTTRGNSLQNLDQMKSIR